MYDLLKGIRILDLTSVVLGPFATQHLGDLGADVIKIEPLSGDIFRHAKPSRSKGMGFGHLAFNRNKRSIALNLKDEIDNERCMALLKNADVLVHNMRPAAAKRLGLDPGIIRKKFPNIVYCVSTGYGSRGSNADLPAYDDIIQAASGVAHLNRDQSGEPRYLPTVLCDKIGGLHLAMGVLAGVVQQSKTGEGCLIEAPMFEGMTSFLMAEHLGGATFRPTMGDMGYARLLSKNRKPFKTKDGYISVMPYNGKHWMSFLTLVGHDDLAHADWVQDSEKRSDNIDSLYAIINEIMPTRFTDEWIRELRQIDIPCTQVNAFEDLLEDKHLQDVGMFQNIEHPTEGALRAIRSPFWVDGAKEHPDQSAPKLNITDIDIQWKPKREH